MILYPETRVPPGLMTDALGMLAACYGCFGSFATTGRTALNMMFIVFCSFFPTLSILRGFLAIIFSVCFSKKALASAKSMRLVGSI